MKHQTFFARCCCFFAGKSWKRKDFFCVSDGWIFRDGTHRPERIINVRVLVYLFLSLLIFSFSLSKKNGLGQDEQLLTIRHCYTEEQDYCSFFITDKERYRLRVTGGLSHVHSVTKLKKSNKRKR